MSKVTILAIDPAMENLGWMLLSLDTKLPERELLPQPEPEWITSKDKTGKRIIDVFKSDRSQLFVTSIPEIGGYCFSTSQQDITDTLNTLG